jgi:uncharacterized protein YjdB
VTLANSSANQPTFVVNLQGTGFQPVWNITVTGALGATTISTLGGALQLTANTSPANSAITWSSSAPLKATVDSSGLVTAKGNGSVNIIATAADGSGITGSLGLTISGQ